MRDQQPASVHLRRLLPLIAAMACLVRERPARPGRRRTRPRPAPTLAPDPVPTTTKHEADRADPAGRLAADQRDAAAHRRSRRRGWSSLRRPAPKRHHGSHRCTTRCLARPRSSTSMPSLDRSSSRARRAAVAAARRLGTRPRRRRAARGRRGGGHGDDADPDGAGAPVRLATAIVVALALVVVPSAKSTVSCTIVSGTHGDNGWYVSPVKVQITSTGSGTCPNAVITFTTSSDTFSVHRRRQFSCAAAVQHRLHPADGHRRVGRPCAG